MKKITFNSPVILSFALISGIVLIANYLTAGWLNSMFFSVYKGSFKDPLFYLRLLTHVLGHSNWEHYYGNMILLLLVGPILEEKYGSMPILSVIVAVALITGVVHILLPGNSALLGASGVVFSFILLASVTGSGRGIPATLIIACLLYISKELYAGIAVRDNISQLTHIIGGSIGAVYGLAIRKN